MTTLELSVSRTETPGEYRIQLLDAGMGDASGTASLEADDLLEHRDGWQQAILASAASTRRTLPQTERELRGAGERLFDAIFHDSAVCSRYRASLAVAQTSGESLRLALRLQCPELAALPWEAMFDKERGLYLARTEPLVRRVPVSSVRAALEIQPPLRILGVAAMPRGLALLDVEREKDSLERALASRIDAGDVELRWVQEATWESIQEVLLSETWHVIHFIGHGDYDREQDEGVLSLVREDGRENRVEASRFADLMHEARPMPRLVMLNSCSSGSSGGNDVFNGTAAALVRSGVTAVAAMQFEITDGAALDFCRGFYTALAHGRPVDEAVNSGRIAILGRNGQTLEWVTPVLYLRGDDARIFAVARSQPDGAHGSPLPPRRAPTPEPSDAGPAVVEERPAGHPPRLSGRVMATLRNQADLLQQRLHDATDAQVTTGPGRWSADVEVSNGKVTSTTVVRLHLDQEHTITAKASFTDSVEADGLKVAKGALSVGGKHSFFLVDGTERRKVGLRLDTPWRGMYRVRSLTVDGHELPITVLPDRV